MSEDQPVTGEVVKPKEETTGVPEIDRMIDAIQSREELDEYRVGHAVYDLRQLVAGIQNSVVYVRNERERMNKEAGEEYQYDLTPEEQVIFSNESNYGPGRRGIGLYGNYVPNGWGGRTNEWNAPKNPQNELWQSANLLDAMGMLPEGITPDNLQNKIAEAEAVEVSTDQELVKARQKAEQNARETGELTVVRRNITGEDGNKSALNIVSGFRNEDDISAVFGIRYDGKSGRPVAASQGVGINFPVEKFIKIAHASPKEQVSLDPPKAKIRFP